jgi:hypothetical protein
MENKTIFIGLGVLAVGGFLAWKYFKKPITTIEEPTNEPINKPSSGGYKLSTPQEDAIIKPSTTLNTKAGGNSPVQGLVVDPNKMASEKPPFVNASVMKSLTIRLTNGDIVNVKKGDKISVANTYGDSIMTYVEGNSSQKLKWDVDVYFPRYGNKINTSSGIGSSPQFDGGQTKGHNFPYFY